MTALQTAQLYFDLSNKSDFEGIAKLFTEPTTYSSHNTGSYLGANAILTMQKEFHARFERLHWIVNSIEEIKPGVVLVNYEFEATTKSGESINSAGLEYITVENEKIQHIEIQNK